MAQIQSLSIEFDRMKLSLIEEIQQKIDDFSMGGENYFNSCFERVEALATNVMVTLKIGCNQLIYPVLSNDILEL